MALVLRNEFLLKLQIAPRRADRSFAFDSGGRTDAPFPFTIGGGGGGANGGGGGDGIEELVAEGGVAVPTEVAVLVLFALSALSPFVPLAFSFVPFSSIVFCLCFSFANFCSCF